MHAKSGALNFLGCRDQTHEGIGQTKNGQLAPTSIAPFGNTKHVEVYFGLSLTRLFMQNPSPYGYSVYNIPATAE